MGSPLISALREGRGYLEDEGWHQTAQLMTLAAEEIERLAARVEELEAQIGDRDIPDRTRRLIQIAAASRAMR